MTLERGRAWPTQPGARDRGSSRPTCAVHGDKCVPLWQYQELVRVNRELSLRLEAEKERTKKLETLVNQAEQVITSLAKERDELKEENLHLKAKIALLETKLSEQKQRAFIRKRAKKELPQAPQGEKFKQLTLFDIPAPQTRKWATLKGHIGTTRNKKDGHIGQVIEVKPSKCNKCGSENLRVLENSTEHVQEDIDIRKIKTLYIHYQAYCQNCRSVSTPIGEGELLRSYIGPKARAIAIGMCQEGIPKDKVARIFKDLFDFHINPSSICLWQKETAKEAAPLYEQILQKLQKSDAVYIDETSWYISGKMHWLWTFTNENWCLYKIDKSRSSKVVEEVLTQDYSGIMISDCYNAYNCVKALAKQKCLSHILRHIEEAIEEPQDKARLTSIKQIIMQAIHAYKSYKEGNITKEDLTEEKSRAQRLLSCYINTPFSGEKSEKVRGMLVRHEKELFVFMDYPDIIEPTNNRAERELRYMVIARKNSFGNRTKEGADYMAIISSVFQTAKRKGMKPLDIILTLLTRADKHELKKSLFGSNERYVQLTLNFVSTKVEPSIRSPPE